MSLLQAGGDKSRRSLYYSAYAFEACYAQEKRLPLGQCSPQRGGRWHSQVERAMRNVIADSLRSPAFRTNDDIKKTVRGEI